MAMNDFQKLRAERLGVRPTSVVRRSSVPDVTDQPSFQDDARELGLKRPVAPTPVRRPKASGYNQQAGLIRAGIAPAHTNDPRSGIPYEAQKQQIEENSAPKKKPEAFGLPQIRQRNVRELTQDEWNALSPEQQKGVLANFALYQAAQADLALGAKTSEEGDGDYRRRELAVTGEGRTSDTYAPNTVRVLEDLGIKNDKLDIDDVLSGRAITGYDEISGISKRDENRSILFDQLSNSQVFQTPEVQSTIAAGRSLLDALSASNTVSDETKTFASSLRTQNMASNSLSEDQRQGLDRVLELMSRRAIWDAAQTDSSVGADLQSEIDTATASLDPNVVSRYFKESYDTYGFGGDNNYMSYDEFARNWLQ